MRTVLSAALITLALGACGLSGDTDSEAGAGGSGGSDRTSGGGSTAGDGGSTSTNEGGGGRSETGGGGGRAPDCTGKTLLAGDTDETLSFGGDDRTFHVHIPASYDATKATELILVYPGFAQSDSDIATVTGLTSKSDAHGFIVVYVQGLNDSFNAGACCGLSSAGGVDDVGFTASLIAHLEDEYCIDEKHVHATGFSNGGMMSHRLACEMSDKIASIGAVSGTIAVDDCAPTRAVPILHVHGKDDLVVPYDGNGLDGAESVGDTISFWVKNDGCTDAAPAEVYMNGDATCSLYSACHAGSAVELCTISDGGHQWPGGQTSGDLLGTLSMDLDASETIVKFFAAHPLP